MEKCREGSTAAASNCYRRHSPAPCVTGGRGVHSEEFSHYEEMPRDTAEKVIEEAKKLKANHQPP
jgi:elongation factor G